MDRTAILSDGIEECQFRLTLCGFGPFFLFYGGDFVEAPLVAATEVGGGQENLHHGNGRFAGDDAAAKREHVRIVVFPRQACCIDVMRQCGADAWHFVGRNGDANPGPANGDAKMRLLRHHSLAHRLAVVRIVDGFFGRGSQIADRLACALEIPANRFFDGESGVVRTNGDARLGGWNSHGLRSAKPGAIV